MPQRVAVAYCVKITRVKEMTLLQSILLGIIQGVTEFLPVSSSGHLAIFQALFGLEKADMLFDILLHVGTLVAISVVYFMDLKKLVINGFCILGCWFYNAFAFIANLFAKEKREYKKVVTNAYRKFVLLVIVSSIPTAIIGVLDSDIVEAASNTLLIPGICLIITAGVLLIAQFSGNGNKMPGEVKYSEAGLIGVAQGIATMPGISRSGSTVAACLLCGFDKKFAVKYSFIMSIPAILGSLLLELVKTDLSGVTSGVLVNYIVGTVVAAVVGYIFIKVMLAAVKKKKFTGFSIYCFVAGVTAIVLHFIKL